MKIKTQLSTGARRLRILASYIDVFVPDEAFSVDEYAKVIDPQGWLHHTPSIAQINALRLGYQATACAIGHACLCPTLRQEGIKLKDGVRTPGTLELCFDVEYRGRKNKDAAMRFFYMDADEIESVFYKSKPEKPLNRRRMVKRLVKQAKRMENEAATR